MAQNHIEESDNQKKEINEPWQHLPEIVRQEIFDQTREALEPEEPV